MATVYLAKVTEVEFNTRRVKVANSFASTQMNWVVPAYEGGIKLPIAVDDVVLVLTLDSTNIHRYYLPVRGVFSALSDDATKLQIESSGALELEGSEIKIGSAAVEPALLGDTLIAALDSYFGAGGVSSHLHIGNMGFSTGPPVGPTAVPPSLTPAKSTKVKVQ